MFAARTPTSAKKIANCYVPQPKSPITWSTNAYFDFNLDIVRLVAKKVCYYLWREATEAQQERLYDIVFASLRCIPSEVILFYNSKTPREVDEAMVSNWGAMDALKSVKRDSPLLNKRMEQLNSYYEQMFIHRAYIQNKYWEYKGLNEDAALFIKLHEKYKMYNRDYSKFEKSYNGKECMSCKHPCVRPTFNLCTYCQEFDRLEMFIKVCKCFRIMGSFYLFYWYLSTTTIDYMIKNWELLSTIFSRGLEASPLDFYLNESSLLDLKNEQKEKEMEEEIEKDKDKDEMYQLICELYGEQEKRDQKVKEEQKKYYMAKLKKKRAEEQKKKWIKDLYQKHLSEQKKNSKKIEEAALLKSLTEDPHLKKS